MVTQSSESCVLYCIELYFGVAGSQQCVQHGTALYFAPLCYVCSTAQRSTLTLVVYFSSSAPTIVMTQVDCLP